MYVFYLRLRVFYGDEKKFYKHKVKMGITFFFLKSIDIQINAWPQK